MDEGPPFRSWGYGQGAFCYDMMDGWSIWIGATAALYKYTMMSGLCETVSIFFLNHCYSSFTPLAEMTPCACTLLLSHCSNNFGPCWLLSRCLQAVCGISTTATAHDWGHHECILLYFSDVQYGYLLHHAGMFRLLFEVCRTVSLL